MPHSFVRCCRKITDKERDDGCAGGMDEFSHEWGAALRPGSGDRRYMRPGADADDRAGTPCDGTGLGKGQRPDGAGGQQASVPSGGGGDPHWQTRRRRYSAEGCHRLPVSCTADSVRWGMADHGSELRRGGLM